MATADEKREKLEALQKRLVRMKNPNLGMAQVRNAAELKDRYTFTKGLPTRENCSDDPREMFLWMFTGLPGLHGAPMMFPTPMLMMWSEHLYECGARASAEPVKKYRPPTASEPHWATSPGTWVDANTPDPPPEEPPARKALEPLGLHQKAELFRELRQQLSPTQKRALLLEQLGADEAQQLIGWLQEVIDDATE